VSDDFHLEYEKWYICTITPLVKVIEGVSVPDGVDFWSNPVAGPFNSKEEARKHGDSHPEINWLDSVILFRSR